MKSKSSYSDEAKKALLKIIPYRIMQRGIKQSDINDPKKRKEIIASLKSEFLGMSSEEVIRAAQEYLKLYEGKYDVRCSEQKPFDK